MSVSCGEYTFGYGFYFLYGVECVRVEIFDYPDHLLEILSLDDGKDHLNLAGTTFPVDTCHAVIMGA